MKITFINARGDSVELAHRSPFFINKIEGLGDVEADVQSQKAPFQDGSTFIDSVFAERFISLEVAIMKDFDVNRRLLSSVFNPKLGEGTIVYEKNGLIREIKAIAEHIPSFPDNRPNPYRMAMIDLICHNPYWQSTEVTEDPVFEPLFSFPFSGAFEMGIQRDERIIYNDGDAPTPVQIEFYGPAMNPVITNVTTGEFIKVNRTLVEGEYLRIDTTRGQKSVVLVSEDGTETNVFNWIDIDSTFFELAIGENIVEYASDSDVRTTVNINYKKLYNAV